MLKVMKSIHGHYCRSWLFLLRVEINFKNSMFFDEKQKSIPCMLAGTDIFLESCSSKPNLDCNYHFPIDLGPNGTPFTAKSIGNYNPNLVWINKIPIIFLCV